MQENPPPIPLEYARPAQRAKRRVLVPVLMGAVAGSVTILGLPAVGSAIIAAGAVCGLLVGFVCGLSARSHVILAGVAGNLVAACVCLGLLSILLGLQPADIVGVTTMCLAIYIVPGLFSGALVLALRKARAKPEQQLENRVGSQIRRP
jgi:hypothetical protein